MAYKVVSIFQQSFHNDDPKATEQTFTFQLLPKTNQNQYYRLRCVYLSSLQSEPINTEVFIKGIDELNGKCSYQSIGSGGKVISKSDWYLGTFSDNYAEYSQMKMRLSDMPARPFIIYTEGTPSKFVVSLQIELIEETFSD